MPSLGWSGFAPHWLKEDLERLVESLDLPACLRVVDARVPELDAQLSQLILEDSCPTPVPSGEDAPVVCKEGSRQTPLLTGKAEDVDNVSCRGHLKCRRRKAKTGVVVDEVADLDLGELASQVIVNSLWARAEPLFFEGLPPLGYSVFKIGSGSPRVNTPASAMPGP